MIACRTPSLARTHAIGARRLQGEVWLSATPTRGWLAVALLVIATGCYDLTHARNPGFCCEDPARCKEWGAPGPIACETPGEVCDVVHNRCVLAECSYDQECTDPAQAFCMRGRCESCVDNLSCASLAGRSICDDGALMAKAGPSARATSRAAINRESIRIMAGHLRQRRQ